MNEIVRWDEVLAKQAKEVAALERPALSQISTRAGQLKYQDQPIPGNKLQCIVVASAFENRYYDKKFDPNKREPPKCFALSLDGENMVPHEVVKEPEAPSCDACPFSKWQSDPNGGKGKACKNVRRLALIPTSAAANGGSRTAEVALLSVPVTSAKNWANYVNLCSAEYARPPWAVITEIYTEPDAKTQFQIKFRTVGLIEDAMLGDIHHRTESVKDTLLTPYDMSGLTGGSYPGESEESTKSKKY